MLVLVLVLVLMLMLIMVLVLVVLSRSIVLVPHLLLWLLVLLLLVRLLVSVHILLLLLDGRRRRLVVRARMVDLALELPELLHQPGMHRGSVGRVEAREDFCGRRLGVPRVRVRRSGVRRRGTGCLRRRSGRRHAGRGTLGAVRLGRDSPRSASAEDRQLVRFALRRARREDIRPQRLKAFEVGGLRLLLQLAEGRLYTDTEIQQPGNGEGRIGGEQEVKKRTTNFVARPPRFAACSNRSHAARSSPIAAWAVFVEPPRVTTEPSMT